MAKLTPLEVKNAKPGRHSDGGGLHLLVKPSGAKSWVLRVQFNGQRRDIGLGSADTVTKIDRVTNGALLDDVSLMEKRILTVAEAREKAMVLRRLAKAGRDPVTERDKDRSAPPTFSKAALLTHEAFKEGWSARAANTFLAALKEHANPILGNRRVDQIEAADVAAVLRPLWNSKPATAARLRQQIGRVLNFAKANKWRSSEAPVKELSLLLGKQRRGGNYPAMPYAEVPAYFQELRQASPTMGRLALMFIISTAARSGEVRHARWGQIDEKKKIWSRPASMMKGDLPHDVTLNKAAIQLLEQAKQHRVTHSPDEFIFPSAKRRSLSDMTISKVMAGLPYVPHGLRSSFRDWAAEQMPHIPDPVAEAAIAHVVTDKVVAAYKRTKFLELRRQLLEAWSDYLVAGKEGPL